MGDRARPGQQRNSQRHHADRIFLLRFQRLVLRLPLRADVRLHHRQGQQQQQQTTGHRKRLEADTEEIQHGFAGKSKQCQHAQHRQRRNPCRCAALCQGVAVGGEEKNRDDADRVDDGKQRECRLDEFEDVHARIIAAWRRRLFKSGGTRNPTPHGRDGCRAARTWSAGGSRGAARNPPRCLRSSGSAASTASICSAYSCQSVAAVEVAAGLAGVWHSSATNARLDQAALVVALLVPGIGEEDVHAVEAGRRDHVLAALRPRRAG